MPPETPKIARWKLITGYSAFGVFSFIFFLYLTFPYDVVKQRVVSEAASAGWKVTMDSLGPGLFGVTASGVKLSKIQDENAPKPAEGAPELPPSEPLYVGTVSARPALFPPGVALRAKAFGGTITGAVGGLSDLHVDFAFSNLDPSQGNLKGFTGLDLSGKLDGDASLLLPRAGREYDLSQANGSINLDVEKLVLKGGTVVVPMYGTPTPMELPKIGIGDVQGKVKIDKGMATLDQFRGKGEDLELAATGTVKLAKRPDYSELNLELKLKAEPDFVKRLGILGSGLSILPTDRENDKFRVAKINGYLGRPNLPMLNGMR